MINMLTLKQINPKRVPGEAYSRYTLEEINHLSGAVSEVEAW